MQPAVMPFPVPPFRQRAQRLNEVRGQGRRLSEAKDDNPSLALGQVLSAEAKRPGHGTSSTAAYTLAPTPTPSPHSHMSTLPNCICTPVRRGICPRHCQRHFSRLIRSNNALVGILSLNFYYCASSLHSRRFHTTQAGSVRHSPRPCLHNTPDSRYQPTSPGWPATLCDRWGSRR